MQTIDQFPHAVIEHPNVWIPLSDGTRLAARMWLPEGAEKKPVPAILEYLPYRKRDGTAVRDQLTYPYFAGHGYACLRLDMRGNGESDGVMLDEYAPQEQDDAVEVIQWIAAQGWCSGKVGMMGISWGGFNGLQVAARRPQALRAIITLCSTDDRYADDIHFKGGCLINENLGWGATMLAYSSRPPDPALVGDAWRGMWMERLEIEPFLAARWLRHPLRDAYWRHGSVCEDFAAIEAAVLAVGGWNDAYSNAIPRLVNKLRSPARGIIGPWAHKYPHFAVPEPRIGFLQEALRWWDFWLKGEVTGVMRDPALRYYVIDAYRPEGLPVRLSGRWLADGTWPPPHAETLKLHLNRAGLSETEEKPGRADICSAQTVGMDAGEFCIIWLGPEFAGDQRADDEGSLTFQTPPLGVEMDIVGQPALDLVFSADKPVAQVAVRLNDVWPDGAVTRISYALMNLTHLHGHDESVPLQPGKRYRARIALDDIAWRVPKEHRLRVAISTTYWPLMWPSPKPVTLSVLTGESAIEVPVRPAAASDTAPQFPEAVAAPALRQEELRPPANKRERGVDPETGAVTLTIEDDFGKYRNAEHGLVTGSVGREFYSIIKDDPLSAYARCHWSEELEREDWRVRTETYSGMRADATHFHLTARIEAYEDDELVFEKGFAETIPREGN